MSEQTPINPGDRHGKRLSPEEEATYSRYLAESGKPVLSRYQWLAQRMDETDWSDRSLFDRARVTGDGDHSSTWSSVIGRQSGNVDHPLLDRIVHEIPATYEAAFAQVRRGGTGRYNLIANEPTTTGLREVVVVSSLSKGQARTAADLINRAFVAWLPHTGALLIKRSGADDE